METVLNLISSNISLFVLIMIGLFLLTVILFFVIVLRLYKSLQKYKGLLRGTEGKNLEEILVEKGRVMEHILLEMDIIRDSAKTAEENSKNSIQKVGLVRYNAFEDTGGDLSFALALLNCEADGCVLSGIFSQEDSRTYCKPVFRGESKHQLSKEERKAIAQALKHKFED